IRKAAPRVSPIHLAERRRAFRREFDHTDRRLGPFALRAAANDERAGFAVPVLATVDALQLDLGDADLGDRLQARARSGRVHRAEDALEEFVGSPTWQGAGFLEPRHIAQRVRRALAVQAV